MSDGVSRGFSAIVRDGDLADKGIEAILARSTRVVAVFRGRL
jgi:hypothetical protein